MSRISAVFEKPNHKALIAYITVGYPDLESTLRAVPLLVSKGVDIVELGIPFSDPLADGATIQESSYQALQNGVTPELCINIATRLRKEIAVPLVFMTYFNPVFSYGVEKFCRNSVQGGIDGLIVPDLPPEEGSVLEGVAAQQGIDVVYLLSPSSTEERVRRVAQKSRGFIYLVSVTGVTGARETVPPGLAEFVQKVRRYARQPLCVGFGISSARQAQQIAALADGVIIGSRLIQLMKADHSLESLGEFVQSVRQALG